MTSDNNSPAFSGGGIDLTLLSLTSNNNATTSRSRPSAHDCREERRLALAEEAVAELSVDEVAIIFSFLPPNTIMLAQICTTWRDAAKKTIVPLCYFAVRDAKSYNAMRAMATALPNLQELSIGHRGYGNKYIDGEDPDEAFNRSRFDYYRTYDINIISNFSKLRILNLFNAPLNGRYPALFNFPLLEKLIITNCYTLKWDLEMLSGCPLLKELYSIYGPYPTGNLSSLRVLRDTIEQELDLEGTAVTGDIRDIRAGDFPAIKKLLLPGATVVGGNNGYKFERISDISVVMQTIHPLLKHTPSLVKDWNGHEDWHWMLSQDSPDWYEEDEEYRDEGGDPPPPFRVEFVKAGSRLGWTWYTPTIMGGNIYCAVNWLDPEPSSDSDDYETYIRELQEVNRRIGWLYEDYHEPPNEEQYRRICVEFREYEGRA